MSKRKSERPLQKVTVNLYKGDFAALAVLHPQLGASVALRELLASHLRATDAIASRIAPVIRPKHIPLPEKG